MPKTTVNFPPLSTEKSDQAVISLRGLGMRNLGDGQLQYAQVPTIHAAAPVDTAFNINLNAETETNKRYGLPPVSELTEVKTIGDVTNPLLRDFFLYGDHNSGGVFCRYNDNTIRNIKSEGEIDNDIRNAPDTIGYPIFFNGSVYLIYPNGSIYQLESLGNGGLLITTNLNDAKLSQNIAVGTDSDVIGGVSVWLNRVWLEWSGPPGRIFWSEINNIRQWLQYDPTTDTGTTAGVRDSSDKILAFHTFGQTGLLFTDNDILRVTVSDITDTFFSFVPLNYKDIFVGGAITKQGALYYVSRTGISQLGQNGGVTHVSSPLDNVILRAIADNVKVNVVEKDRYIIWSFGDRDNTVIFFDAIDGTWSYSRGSPADEEGDEIRIVGTVTQLGKTIGSFKDANGRSLKISEVPGTFGFYGSPGKKPCGIFNDGTVKFFDAPDRLEITCIMERTARGNAFAIQTISLPEMQTDDWQVEIRDLDFTNSDKTYMPNQYNEVHVCDKYSSPEIKFVITRPRSLQSLQRFDLDAEIVRY